MINPTDLTQGLDNLIELIERGEFVAANSSAQSLRIAHPQVAEVWRLSAIAALQSGNFNDADAALTRALELDPELIEAWCNRASLQKLRGQTDAAETTLRHALSLVPGHVAALNNLGRLLHERSNYIDAAECFENCARVQPDHIEAWLNLANTRFAQFRLADAEACARRALEINKRSADAWYLLGYLFERQGKLSDAAVAYRASMEISPRSRTAHNLGLVFDQLGDWQASARMLESALQLDPNQQQTLAQLVFTTRRLCDWSNLAALSRRLIAAVDAHTVGITPFSFLAEDSLPSQQLDCARVFARQFGNTATGKTPPFVQTPGSETEKTRNSPIRVGFVSSGFADHATGLLVVELIEHLRACALTSIGFATTADDHSEIRRRLVAGFHDFHDVSGLSPDAIAKTIRSMRCDVLIDIDGYCMNSTPGVFALKPAPTQVNWLAYPGSLGAPWYDYLIADSYVIPAEQHKYYDEKIVWLPRCYQPTDTTRIVTEPPSREICGLPKDKFVYCCFNNSWKFTPQSFERWVRIMNAVPDSVLWLLDGPPGNGISTRLQDSARRAGIDPRRLIFSPKLKHADYLALYRHADLFLDTNPYNAHTTASDALWAGCPVLTRPGKTFASRVAGSLNHYLGLDELNADSDQAYVDLAIALARAPERMLDLRGRLESGRQHSGLFDMRGYARDFEQALVKMVELS